MSSPAHRKKAASFEVAKEILADIVSSFVLTEDLSHVLTGVEALDEQTIKDRKLTVVYRMLFENPDGKAALAQLYANAVNASSKGSKRTFTAWAADFKKSKSDDALDVFIESGSTLLYVSHALRKVFKNIAGRRLLVRTNNHLTAWLYLNKKKYHDCLVPFLFSGALEEKYHGIFPFYIGGEPRKKEEEQTAYAQCRFDMAQCNVLLLAASRLSLCYGPLVGSLENALFKHASYSACVPRREHPSETEIHLLITADKLIAHQPDFPPGCHSISEELAKVRTGDCFPVFDLRLQTEDEQETTKSPFSSKLVPDTTQPLKDGTRAVQFGDARFRVCDTWEELLTEGQLKVCVFISHRDHEIEWIRREIDLARSYFADRVDLHLHPIKQNKAFEHSMSCLVLEKKQ